LRAAFGDPNRAFEYLMGGMPMGGGGEPGIISFSKSYIYN